MVLGQKVLETKANRVQHPPAMLPTPLGSDSWLGLHSH